MTTAQVAANHRAVAALADTLQRWGLTDPQQRAEEFAAIYAAILLADERLRSPEIQAQATSHGDPRLPARLWKRIRVADTGCWLWDGSVDGTGYGRTHIREDGRERSRAVHRLTYEALVAAIPPGMQIDHLCRTRTCCNPAHLEPVTHRENAMRGISRTRINAEKTHCLRGHPLSGESIWVDKRGRRRCLECARVHNRTWRERIGQEEYNRQAREYTRSRKAR